MATQNPVPTTAVAEFPAAAAADTPAAAPGRAPATPAPTPASGEAGEAGEAPATTPSAAAAASDPIPAPSTSATTAPAAAPDPAREAHGTAHAAADPRTRYLMSDSKVLAAFQSVVVGLTKLGVSLFGSRVLSVRGRKSGEWRSVPVNLMPHDGELYLVAPRGHTQWVRNLRVAGDGRLRVGRKVQTFTATEIADEAKPAILRSYLKRWGWEVGAFFEGVDKNATDATLLEIAPGFPVFRIEIRPERPAA